MADLGDNEHKYRETVRELPKKLPSRPQRLCLFVSEEGATACNMTDVRCLVVCLLFTWALLCRGSRRLVPDGCSKWLYCTQAKRMSAAQDILFCLSVCTVLPGA